MNELCVHPLILVSISDHYTTILHQSATNTNSVAAGLIFGTINDNVLDALDTIEIPCTFTGNTVTVRHEQLQHDIELYIACYPSYQCIGFYTTSNNRYLNESVGNATYQYQLNKHHTIYLYLDVVQSMNKSNVSLHTQLPIKLSQYTFDNIQFIDIPYTIKSDASERIVCVYNSMNGGSGNKLMQLQSHYNTLQHSVQSLNLRLQAIIQYLQNKSTITQLSHDDITALLDIHSLAQQHTIINPQQHNIQYNTEYCDALMLQYQAELTSGTSTLTDVVDKYSLIQQSIMQAKKNANINDNPYNRDEAGKVGILNTTVNMLNFD